MTYSKNKDSSLSIIWENKSLADSVRFKAIMDFYLNNTQSSPNSSLQLSNYHYKLAKQLGNRKEEALALNEKAIVYYMLGYKLDSVNAVLQEVLPIYTELNNYNGIASTKNNIAALFQDKGDFRSALNYYRDALTLFKAQKNKLMVADVLNNIAGIYYIIELYELALPNYKEALTIYTKEGADEKAGFLWLNMANIYSKTGRTKIAKEHFQKSYQILKAKNDLYYLPQYFYLVALFHESSGNPDSALLMIDEGLKILNELGNKDKIISSKLLKAKLLVDSNLVEAYRIVEELKEPILNGSNKLNKSALFQLLYQYYKKHENFKIALDMHEKYLLYTDSVQLEENKTAIVREALRADYNAKLFDNQLETEKRLAQLKLRQLKLVYSLTLIGLIIILILSFYYQSRIKKNQTKRDLLLSEIEQLKQNTKTDLMVVTTKFELIREKIEKYLGRKINDTDWKVLNLLLENPVITNKEIASKAFMSIDGIGSSLRRMYEYFEIKESKYMKISLLLEAIKSSNHVK